MTQDKLPIQIGPYEGRIVDLIAEELLDSDHFKGAIEHLLEGEITNDEFLREMRNTIEVIADSYERAKEEDEEPWEHA